MISYIALFGTLLAGSAIGIPVQRDSIGNGSSNTTGKGEDDAYPYALPHGYRLDSDLLKISRCGPDFCANTKTSNNTFYVCGDSRLGPVILPTCSPLSSLVGDDSPYRRFGGLCPAEFISRWTNSDGFFFYPNAGGFANNTLGQPVQGRLTLQAGTMVDRFGSTRGSYVSPAGSPYFERALPPSNLDYDSSDVVGKPYNYHVYVVYQPVTVLAGPVTPWFGQAGFGTQFALDRRVQDYLDDGVFGEVDVVQRCEL